MTQRKTYLIEPLAPLVFRSGKPFGSQASASDVIFPLPSAVAGLTRATSIHQNKISLDEHQVKRDGKAQHDKKYKDVLSIKANGPYLARFDQSKSEVEILVPKPADALYFEAKPKQGSDEHAQVKLIRLAPKALDADCGSDLPEGLYPVQMTEKLKGKPKSGVAYWTLEHLKKWQAGDDIDFEQLQNKGVTQLPIEVRTHVAIDEKSKASKVGQLFQTANLDLGYAKIDGEHNQEQVWSDKRLGFVIETLQVLTEDMVTFGGERRLSKFIPIGSIQNWYDDNLDTLLDDINANKGMRLTFLTPCVFANGYLPTWIDEQTMQGTLPNTEAKVCLKACAIDRWQPVSGWDSIFWKPKAMRKAISSGSVYWFELMNELSMSDLQELVNHVWSDDEQDKRDGFGSALIAPWQADL